MRILLLGASGSIGQQTLDVVNDHKCDFEITGISVGHKIGIVEKLIKLYSSIKFICVEEKEDFDMLTKKYQNIFFFYGNVGLIELIDKCPCDLVVNALVGFVGLAPTIRAIEQNNDIAIANKESIVVGGELINKILKKSSSHIYPIDSEHVALSKCLVDKSPIRRLVLTASGGAFRNLNYDELKNVTKEAALKHPSWKMGPKITIDCATMMNKGFEIVEAHYLFNIPEEKISVLMHDESIVHSLVEYQDGSFLADIGPHDMRIPISYALYKCHRQETPYELKLEDFGTFHFHEFDSQRYPLVNLARECLKQGGTMLAALNAANEEAVYAFLVDEISFLDIEKVINIALKRHRIINEPTLDDLVYVDRVVREEVHKIIKEEII